jgi:hypothetical protein
VPSIATKSVSAYGVRSEVSKWASKNRGNVLARVVEGAQQITQHMDGIGQVIERMARTELERHAQRQLAQRALELRYRGQKHFPFDAGRLLEARRESDQRNDLWTVYNKVQENVICGGIAGRTATGRRSTNRRINSIDENIRINVALWQEAMAPDPTVTCRNDRRERGSSFR